MAACLMVVMQKIIGKIGKEEAMSRDIWYQCGRKNRYRDEHTANHYRKLFEKQRGKKLDYYWCTYCNGFHLTSAVDCECEITTKTAAYAM